MNTDEFKVCCTQVTEIQSATSTNQELSEKTKIIQLFADFDNAREIDWSRSM